MRVVQSVVMTELLCRNIHFVGDSGTTSVPKYAAMEKFIKKWRELPVVERKRTTPKRKSVARNVLRQNSSAKESDHGTGVIR